MVEDSVRWDSVRWDSVFAGSLVADPARGTRRGDSAFTGSVRAGSLRGDSAAGRSAAASRRGADPPDWRSLMAVTRSPLRILAVPVMPMLAARPWSSATFMVLSAPERRGFSSCDGAVLESGGVCHEGSFPLVCGRVQIPGRCLGQATADRWSHMQHSEAGGSEGCRHVEGAARWWIREGAASAASAPSM